MRVLGWDLCGVVLCNVARLREKTRDGWRVNEPGVSGVEFPHFCQMAGGDVNTNATLIQTWLLCSHYAFTWALLASETNNELTWTSLYSLFFTLWRDFIHFQVCLMALLACEANNELVTRDKPKNILLCHSFPIFNLLDKSLNPNTSHILKDHCSLTKYKGWLICYHILATMVITRLLSLYLFASFMWSHP